MGWETLISAGFETVRQVALGVCKSLTRNNAMTESNDGKNRTHLLVRFRVSRMLFAWVLLRQ